MIDLVGRTALITGSTDGVGRVVAQQLGAAGMRLFIHGRDAARGSEVVEEIRKSGGQAEFLQADLASLTQVRALADMVAQRTERLDLLINNAGIGMMQDEDTVAAKTEFSFANGQLTSPDFRFADKRRTSAEGHELFLAVNYLAPFQLTHLLLPLLRRVGDARIVNVSSNGQREIDFADIMLTQGYDDFRAYCQSKLALVMFTIDLAETLQGTGVVANALHPGSRMNTNMTRYSGLSVVGSVEDGAAAILNLAIAPETRACNGRYFKEQEEVRANEQAYDSQARARLRELSFALTEFG